jgi:hypothetical protein
MWSGYIGLTIAFVIISSIFLWFFIRTPGRIVIKVLLIPATVWYALVLYYTVPNLMGWPTSQSIPENSQVLAIRIKEPNPQDNDPGAIYIWVNTRPNTKDAEQTLASRLNPKNVFSYDGQNHPRAYQLPYSRGMHKKILEILKQMEGTQGAQLRTKRGKKSDRKTDKEGGDDRNDSPLELVILNPVSAFPK